MIKIFYSLLIVLSVLVAFFVGSNQEKFSNIKNLSIPLTSKLDKSRDVTPAVLKSMLEKKNFVLINVHTPYEGEIEKTDSFIEYDAMVANKTKLPKDLATQIILYCKTGRMSEEAINTLKNMGYTNVKHLVGGMDSWEKNGYKKLDLAKLPDEVLPTEGFTLPVSWGDIGPKLISLGVIDANKFGQAVQLTDEQKEILTKGGEIPIKIDSTNSQFVVDLLWAIGLAQKSLVYEEGPMGKEYKSTVGNFASTGGWTLAKGDAVSYLNKYNLIPLTPEEQRKVSDIAKNVYRPCCGNSTWFPDCNHGMAALAAIELLVSKGFSEAEIYKQVLALNSFWFPDSYLTAATYFARQGTDWKDVDAKLVLGEKFSSGQGAAEVSGKVGPLPYTNKTGGSCGA